jgi:hypothetical protein
LMRLPGAAVTNPSCCTTPTGRKWIADRPKRLSTNLGFAPLGSGPRHRIPAPGHPPPDSRSGSRIHSLQPHRTRNLDDSASTGGLAKGGGGDRYVPGA